MLTPQEVTKKDFSSAAIGGYYKPAVDEFLQQLAQDYSALYKENAILKNKLKVLVDKVEEYRSTEDAMRMALLSAQKTAREMTDNAQTEAAKLLADTESAAQSRKQEILSELALEEAALEKAKEKTAAYISMLKSAAADYESCVDTIYDFIEPEMLTAVKTVVSAAPVINVVSVPEKSKEEEIEETAKSIENSVTKILEQSISSVDDEAAEQDAVQEVVKPAEPAPAKSKIDFSNLQFGSNYSKKQ